MKKIISLILSGALAVAACGTFSASAHVDNNGNYHSSAYYKGQPYSNAHNTFKKYGWGESSEYFSLYKNGSYVANLICLYNPEVIGTELATAWVGTANNSTGFYMDSYMSYNGGSKAKASKTNYANGVIKSTNCYDWVKNSTSITYYGTLYW